jgi:hypothetical protein
MTAPTSGLPGLLQQTSVALFALSADHSLISRPKGEMTRQENIRLSNDPSFGVSRPIRLVVLGCSTLYLLAPTVVSSSSAVTVLS